MKEIGNRYWKGIFRKQSHVLLGLFYSVAFFSQGFTIPKKPTTQTSVYDYVEVLSSSEKQRLAQKLIRYSDTTSTQIVVITIASTQGENINYLAANWGEQWGIGQAKQDNGVLVLLAKDDRKIAIQAGKGTEHLLTDVTSKRIIERVIIPSFKKEDYYNGLNEGVDVIFKVLQGEFKGQVQKKSSKFPKRGRVFYHHYCLINLSLY